jgi:hypothetical protein
VQLQIIKSQEIEAAGMATAGGAASHGHQSPSTSPQDADQWLRDGGSSEGQNSRYQSRPPRAATARNARATSLAASGEEESDGSDPLAGDLDSSEGGSDGEASVVAKPATMQQLPSLPQLLPPDQSDSLQSDPGNSIDGYGLELQLQPIVMPAMPHMSAAGPGSPLSMFPLPVVRNLPLQHQPLATQGGGVAAAALPAEHGGEPYVVGAAGLTAAAQGQPRVEDALDRPDKRARNQTGEGGTDSAAKRTS